MPQEGETGKGASPAVIGEYVERAKARGQGGYTFSSKQLRDAVAKDIRRAGLHVTRGSTRNQRLHPQYVDDVDDGQTGFGNTDYLTAWDVLYEIGWHEKNTASPSYCPSCVAQGAPRSW